MSHKKNAEAFGKLIGQCTGYAGGYNPGSSNLQLTSMTALLNEARQSLKAVYNAEALFSNATYDREVAFKEMRLRCTRIYGALQACGAPEHALEDAKSHIRKMYGRRLVKSIMAKADAAAAEPVKKRMANGNDYVSLTQHFDRLIETLAVTEVYFTNQADLTVEQLKKFQATLSNMNESVNQASMQLAYARQVRDLIMYRKDWNMIQTSEAAKGFVKSAFGFGSPQFRESRRFSLPNTNNHDLERQLINPCSQLQGFFFLWEFTRAIHGLIVPYWKL